MRGPWSRAVLEALGDAELAVDSLEVREGTIVASIGECDVTVEAEVVPRRSWTAMWRFARGNVPLEAAVAGREQSDHLDVLMREDWDAPLVPEGIRTRCSCDGAGRCVHVASVARAVADLIDEDPSTLLRWRGCTPERAQLVLEEEVEPSSIPPEAWEAGELPAPRPLRPLPAGAVLKRLGPSGVRVVGEDLADVLQRAYEALPER